MDRLTIERINLMHPYERENCLAMYKEMCDLTQGKYLIRFSHTLRSFKEQDDLYALGRTVVNPNGYNKSKKPMGNIVTWAKSGTSYHNYGLAWDLVLLLDKDGNGTYETASWDMTLDLDGDGIPEWREIVEIAIKYGYEWGGNWAKPKRDAPHFQRTFGYSIMELKSLWNSKKFIPNTNYVAIQVKKLFT